MLFNNFLYTFYDITLKAGLLCLVDELMSVFIMAFRALIQEEIELSQRVSEEEWEEIRPSRIDRRQSMISFIKVKIINIRKFIHFIFKIVYGWKNISDTGKVTLAYHILCMCIFNFLNGFLDQHCRIFNLKTFKNNI